MRQISAGLKNKMESDSLTGLNHKLLLYRRKWNVDAEKYELEEIPINITKDLPENTTITINNQLDTGEANVWKTGNLALNLNNERNKYWEGIEDGLFPSPYIMYGSKIEYYYGDVTHNDYIKAFTGYITSSPNYRQDTGRIDLQVLNRMDMLKTISAENVSTKVSGKELERVDNKTFTTRPDTAVGRILKVLQGTTLETAVELVEKTDYSISNLNSAEQPATIEIKSEVPDNENIYADYIYWYEGLTIDELVKKILDEAGIGEDQRIVDPVVWENNAIIAYNLYQYPVRARMNYVIDGSVIKYQNNSFSNNQIRQTESIELYSRGGNLSATLAYTSGGNSPIYGFKFITDLGTYRIGKSDNTATGNNTIYIFKNDSQITSLNDGGQLITFNINVNDGLKIYATGDQWSSLNNTLLYSEGSGVKVLEGLSGTAGFNARSALNNITLTTASGFVISQSGFEFMPLTPSEQGWTDLVVTYGNTLGSPSREYFGFDGNQLLPIFIGIPLSGNGPLGIAFRNNATKGNSIDLATLQLRYYAIQNIPLAVCNLTGMNILQALEELASMAMYEIGFDADDKFFFRRRQNLGQVYELEDDQIISLDSVEYDFDRLKTRVAVGYGEFNKVVDAESMEEPAPTNKDKYGERLYEISGSQLLPADNVDLAYAIAPSVYAELGVLRLKLTLNISLNLELELSDYVRIKHNNNIFSNPKFTDYIKRKQTGTYYMTFKIVGKRDVNSSTRKYTALTLVDYTAESDQPQPEYESFVYDIQNEFGELKKQEGDA